MAMFPPNFTPIPPNSPFELFKQQAPPPMQIAGMGGMDPMGGDARFGSPQPPPQIGRPPAAYAPPAMGGEGGQKSGMGGGLVDWFQNNPASVFSIAHNIGTNPFGAGAGFAASGKDLVGATQLDKENKDINKRKKSQQKLLQAMADGLKLTPEMLDYFANDPDAASQLLSSYFEKKYGLGIDEQWVPLTTPEDRAAAGIDPRDTKPYLENIINGDIKSPGGGGNNVNVNSEGGVYGKPGEGYSWVYDDAGNVQMEDVPGSPGDKRPKRVPLFGGDAAAAEAVNMKKLFSETRRTSTVITDIDRIIDIAENPDNPTIFGIAGKADSFRPGSPAADAYGLLDGIKSLLSTGALQEMRDASKNGGAVGSVTEKELDILESTYGKLDPYGMSEDAFIFNLKRVQRNFERAMMFTQAMANGVTDTNDPQIRWIEENLPMIGAADLPPTAPPPAATPGAETDPRRKTLKEKYGLE